MYSLYIKPNKIVKKSFYIADIAKHIIENRQERYVFLINYKIVSVNEFLKIYLQETKSYEEYYYLHKAMEQNDSLCPELQKIILTPTIFQHVRNKKKKD